MVRYVGSRRAYATSREMDNRDLHVYSQCLPSKEIIHHEERLIFQSPFSKSENDILDDIISPFQRIEPRIHWKMFALIPVFRIPSFLDVRTVVILQPFGGKYQGIMCS